MDIIKKLFKRDIYWILVIMVFFMILHLLEINLFVNGHNTSFLIILNLSNIIYHLIPKEEKRNREIIGSLLLPILLLINFYLFNNGIYVPQYIVFFIGMGLLYIYYLNKLNLSNKTMKIGFICLLLLCFFSMDYYMYSNRLIKDINFNKAIKKDFNIDGRIDKESLKGINKLSISSKHKTNTLSGIEHFEDLKTLYIWNGDLIKDYTSLNSLTNLEKLTLWYIDLEELNKLSNLKSLEHLEIIFPKQGVIKNLNNLPNLKQLEVRDLSLNNLNVLKGPKYLEKLSIAGEGVVSIEGIENFPYLKELSLYNLDVSNIDSVLNLSNIEKIYIRDCNIDNYDEFINSAREKGIIVVKTESNLNLNFK